MRLLTALEINAVAGGHTGPGPDPDDEPYHFERKGSAGPFPEDSGPLPSRWADVIDPSLLEQDTATPPPDPDSDPEQPD